MFKIATLTFAAIAGSASIASASIVNIPNFVMVQDRSGQVELGTVTKTDDRVIEVYSFHKGVVRGNFHIDVNIPRQETDAVVFLKVNGQVVETQEIDSN